MTLQMNLTITKPAHFYTLTQWARPGGVTTADANQVIPVGETVEYVAHMQGGMVKVKHAGREVVIRPGCTKELS
jgi:hypothetical protein